MSRLSLVILLLSSALFAQAPLGGLQNTAAPKGTISGIVTRVSTGDPIAKVTVTLARVTPQASPLTPAAPNAGARGAGPKELPGAQQVQVAQVQAQPQTGNITATTDDQGKFQFKDVDAGTYRLVAARNGFARQEYGQRSLNRPGTVLNVRAGQQITDVVLRLTPAGTISGRVLDSTGEPLVGVTVQALRTSYDATGKRALQPVGSARTNDLGEYRLYWINPGRYFVNANTARSFADILSASTSQAAAQPQSTEQAQAVASAASIFGPGTNPNEVADTGFGLTYYPGTNDAGRAVAIDLQPGSEIRAIDFTLVRQQRVKLSGRVIDADTGRPPQGAQVSATSREATSSSSPLDALIGSADPTANRYNPMTGEFVVANVASGSYWLQVISQAANAPQSGAAGPANAADAIALLSSINTARIPIEVGNSDVENLTLTVSSGVSVPGRIRVEGAQAGTAGVLDRIGVTLQASGGLSILSLMGGGAVRPAADGTFSIPRITSGDYKLAVNGVGTNLYVKEARLGQTDALQPLSIALPINGSLDITLGSNPAQITGNVTDAALKPVSGVQAVLIPDQLRNRQDLYKAAVTDQEGRFTIRGITPGDYRLFAWEDIEPFSYYDAAVLRQYEQQGKLVHIQEGSADSVDLKIIPAAAP